MTSSITPQMNTRDGNSPVDEEAVEIAKRIKQKARTRRLQAVQTLAKRLLILPDGSQAIVRFTKAQCLEHQILMVTFAMLAITGLLQRYSQFSAVELVINILGNIETIRTVHHLAAVVFIVQSLFHSFKILELWLIKRERGGMWPYLRDFHNLVQIASYNLGLAKERPEFDRYSIEEKLEYWALLWGTPLMIITGLVMWFPTLVTSILPGDAIPVSRAIHGWEAILATLAILTWHMYHTVIKERNRSIFTGIMSEKEIQHGHILEYRRILAAYEYLQSLNAQKSDGHNLQPVPTTTMAEPEYELVKKDH